MKAPPPLSSGSTVPDCRPTKRSAPPAPSICAAARAVPRPWMSVGLGERGQRARAVVFQGLHLAVHAAVDRGQIARGRARPRRWPPCRRNRRWRSCSGLPAARWSRPRTCRRRARGNGPVVGSRVGNDEIEVAVAVEVGRLHARGHRALGSDERRGPGGAVGVGRRLERDGVGRGRVLAACVIALALSGW